MSKSQEPSSSDAAAPLVESKVVESDAIADPRATFLKGVEEALEDESFIRLTLGKAKHGTEMKRAVATPVMLKIGPKISFRMEFLRREETKNFSPAEAIQQIAELLPSRFLAATAFTTKGDLTLHYSKKGVPQFHKGKATLQQQEPIQHNRTKNYLIAEDAAFLVQLGIASPSGHVFRDRFDKFRQINKFVEIVDTLVRQTDLGTQPTIRAVDFGSGKNYLTFALYEYLAQSFSSALTLTGVESREELVEQGNNVARASRYDGLCFAPGEIRKFQAEPVDIVVALHACDTATDDAIAKAIECRAQVIALAPCCQKYVRPRIQLPPDLRPIFQHGIVLERLAESVTNGLRALVLEAFGYEAKVFEFIGGEHTAKNVMISATRKDDSFVLRERALQDIARVKATFGLEDFYLDRVLELPKVLSPEEGR